MSSDAATTIQPVDWTSSVWKVVCRRTATFLVLEVVSGDVPEPGSYAAEVESGGVYAPCGIMVADEGPGTEVWCQPRGPLPVVARADHVILRFAAR